MRLQHLMLPVAASLLAACSASPSAQSGNDPVPVHRPVPGPSVVVPAAFIVSTNEPFWQARVEGETLLLIGPEGERSYSVKRNTGEGSRRSVWAQDHQGRLDVAVTAQPCLDSMSGAAFPFSATLSFDGGEPVSGCASGASQTVPRPDP